MKRLSDLQEIPRSEGFIARERESALQQEQGANSSSSTQ